MKKLIWSLLLLVGFGLALSTEAYASKYAVVICKVNDRGHLLVETADIDGSCGMSRIGQKSRPCVQVLNKIASKGYELTIMESQKTKTQTPILYAINREDTDDIDDLVTKIEIEIENELVFVLEKIQSQYSHQSECGFFHQYVN